MLEHYKMHQNKNWSDKHEKNVRNDWNHGEDGYICFQKLTDLSKSNDCFFGSEVLVYQFEIIIS